VLQVTYADVDYVGLVDVWFCALASRRTFARTIAIPLARGVSLPDRVGGAPMRFADRRLEMEIGETAGGTRIAVASSCSGRPGTSR
jgi:hypothetical protein